ncbi:putative sulfate exporter family transporter [bacterium AH-315-K05]|nr:putative sulfate exporter family transporter [bacterium AH-315-K05]
MKNKLIGYIGIAILCLISIKLANLVSLLVKFEALTIGILLGITIKYLAGDLSIYSAPINFSAKKLLKLGIILLGFKVNFSTLLELGLPSIIGVALFVTAVHFLATTLGKKLGVENKLALLIGVGSSICGASAIVTIAPIIDANENDAILAVSVVSFLGTLGVLTYSAIAMLPLLSDFQYGVYSGLTLHGLGHAIAAAFARGNYAGEIGTIIKMTRVLFIIPLAIVLSGIYRTKNRNSNEEKVSFPLYVLLFVLMAIVNSLNIIPSNITKLLGTLSSYAILASMIAMGLKVNFTSIKKSGMTTTILGLILFSITSVTILALIVLFL